MVTGSLFLVVGAHSLLAEDQIHLTTAQSQLVAAQAAHRQLLLSVAQLETPSRVVGDAEKNLHMVEPPEVTQLPSVPLDRPLSPPSVAPSTGSTVSSSSSAQSGQSTTGQ